jgi:Tfp pilus assembly protein PilN
MMVPRVHIVLSAPGINHLTLAQFGFKLIIAGTLALTFSFWWLGTTLHEKIAGIKAQTQMITSQTSQVINQAKTAGIDLSNQGIQKIPQQVSFVKQVREHVGFSWTQLLTDLESAVPGHVMMSAVSLDEKTNTVLLNGSTPSLQDLNLLIHQLEKHPAFHDVILTQHANKKNKKKLHAKGLPLIVFSMKVFYAPKDGLSKTIKS